MAKPKPKYGDLPDLTKELYGKIIKYIETGGTLKQISVPEMAQLFEVPRNRLWDRFKALRQVGCLNISGPKQRRNVTLNIRHPGHPKQAPYDEKMNSLECPNSDSPPIGETERQKVEKNIEKKTKEPIQVKDRKRNDIRFRVMAEQLTHSLHGTTSRSFHSKIEAWEKDFKAIHQKDEVPIKRIQAVLKFYCRAIIDGKDCVKKVHSAKHFRGCFTWFEDEMMKVQGSGVSEIDECYLKESIHLIENSHLENSRIDPTQLAHLLALVDDWHQDMVDVVKDLRTRQIADDCTRAKVDGVRPDVLWKIVDTRPEGTSLALLLGDYVRRSTEGWDWNGKLDNYFPGKKQFFEFLQRRCHDLTGRWMWDTELKLCRKVAG